MKLRSIGLAVLAALGIFVFAALIMNFVVMPLFVHQRTSVIVPDVRAVSRERAQRFVERVSLRFRIDRSQYNPDVPEGYVISQRPRANDSVKQGRTVSVVVSLGPKTQRVPELKNMTLRQGRLVLTRQKLAAGRVSRVLREGDTRETVLACSPSAGRQVEEGTEVDVLVAVGGRPKRYIMPDLEGQDLLFIRKKLENSGFRIGNVRNESRRNVYPNTIVDQQPPPGVMIRQGDSIELVAAGSE
ncbi:MAG: PASTA domain-containing protein [Candidatus Krumholzibacteriia bacterium]